MPMAGFLSEAGLVSPAIAARYPEAWGRIEARRAFMGDVLGIRLKPEVLPFSNIPAFLPPVWLARDTAMAVDAR